MPEPARRVSYVLALMASSICAVVAPPLAQAQTPIPAVDFRVNTAEPRYAAIVEDATTGQVLYQERADDERYPASLTKIMTLYLAFEALTTGRLKPTDLITVSRLAASQAPTKLGLRPGDTITVRDAMHAIAVKSANDMAVALAEKIGGTEARFAAMMTLKAQELGMTHTRYVNANGLPDSRQVTSARDIATLCRAVLRDYPQYYHYFGTEEFTYRGVTMYNHNGLLGHMPGVDGFKTGFTNAAGFNLAASAVRDGHRLIAIELGGTTSATRNRNVENLLLTAFDIEERRDHGENILLTQNMFDSPHADGEPVREVRGDSNDPIDVVLTAAEHGTPVAFVPSGVTQLAASRPGLAAQARSAGFAATAVSQPSAQAEPRDWRVQVGVFRTGRLATRQVNYVADRFRSLFFNREGLVEHQGGRYVAVFNGFTEAEAHSACPSVDDHSRVHCAAERR